MAKGKGTMNKYNQKILEMYVEKIILFKDLFFLKKTDILTLKADLIYPRRRIPLRDNTIILSENKKEKSLLPLTDNFADKILFKELIEGPTAVKFFLLKSKSMQKSDELFKSFLTTPALKYFLEMSASPFLSNKITKEVLANFFSGQINKKRIPDIIAKAYFDFETAEKSFALEKKEIKLYAIKDFKMKEKPQQFRKSKIKQIKESEEVGKIILSWRMI